MAKPSAKCHPCRAAGMKQINYFIAPERKAKLVTYCHMRGISMTALLNSFVVRELDENFALVESRYQRRRLHARARAYKRIRVHVQKQLLA